MDNASRDRTMPAFVLPDPVEAWPPATWAPCKRGVKLACNTLPYKIAALRDAHHMTLYSLSSDEDIKW